MPLCIKNFKRFEKNTLRAFFDVELPSGTLHEKEGKSWVGLPSKQYTKPDGTQSWVKIVDFADREKARQFQDIVLPAVEAVAMAEAAP